MSCMKRYRTIEVTEAGGDVLVLDPGRCSVIILVQGLHLLKSN